MIQLVASILLCLIIVDFTLIGFLPRIFKVWLPIDVYVTKNNILGKSALYSFSTNLKHKAWDAKAAYRVQLLYFVVSEDYLIIRNTILTCLPPIRISDIKKFKTKNCLVGIKLYFKIGLEGKKYFKVRVHDTHNWAETFKRIGIKGNVS